MEQDQVKEMAKVTIEFTMKVSSPSTEGKTSPLQSCSFVYGVDVQYPSVETAIMNKRAGDRVRVYVPPEEIFGAYDEELIRELPREDYKQERLAPGRVYRERKQKCLVQFLVKEVRDNVVVADFNDPRAGTWAEFDILVKEVRAATKDELRPRCGSLPDVNKMPEW
ncbi:MAG: hypothetical protein ABFD97_17620 [Syntrophobacter sp.]